MSKGDIKIPYELAETLFRDYKEALKQASEFESDQMQKIEEVRKEIESLTHALEREIRTLKDKLYDSLEGEPKLSELDDTFERGCRTYRELSYDRDNIAYYVEMLADINRRLK